MRKVKRILAVTTAAVMMISMMTSCKDDAATTADGETFTYWTPVSSEASQTVLSYNELLMYQEMEKATGVKVEFVHPAQGSTGDEAFQILMASGDYPDMIEYYWAGYAGGPDQAIDDGVIISLNDYMKEYAPNYYDYMEGERGAANNGLYKAQSLSTNGNYFGFRSMCIGDYRGFSGLYMRKDLLDKWGLDVPETIDDWDLVLKTAKENGIQYPLTGDGGLFGDDYDSHISGAWKVGSRFYIDGDTIKFGPFEEEYKQYLTKMREWYEKGYIDVDYITNVSSDVEGSITGGTSIAAKGYIGSGIGKILPAMEGKDPNFDLVACPAPVLKAGDIPWFQNLSPESADATLAISKQCGEKNEERYKQAIKWADYLYSDEGMILKSFGVEGDTYTVETDADGNKHYKYTDKIYNHEAIGAHSVEAALYKFCRPGNGPGLIQHNDYLDGFYPYQQQKDALGIWNKYVDEAKKHTIPTLTYTSDEATAKSKTEVAEKANIEAAISNYIIGKITLAQYDEAMNKAKAAGYNELIKITQTAYDRYISVLNK